jgi:ABC-type lipopolysaccharide export system ATPase subunit
MIENIALILEVHEKRSTKESNERVEKLLDKISLGGIKNKRLNQCNSLESFYVMLLRAVVYDAKVIVIYQLLSLVDELEDINQIIQNIQKLNISQDIVFADNQNNQSFYANIPIENEKRV